MASATRWAKHNLKAATPVSKRGADYSQRRLWNISTKRGIDDALLTMAWADYGEILYRARLASRADIYFRWYAWAWAIENKQSDMKCLYSAEEIWKFLDVE